MCDFVILILSWKGNTTLEKIAFKKKKNQETEEKPFLNPITNVYAWVVMFLKVELDLFLGICSSKCLWRGFFVLFFLTRSWVRGLTERGCLVHVAITKYLWCRLMKEESKWIKESPFLNIKIQTVENVRWVKEESKCIMNQVTKRKPLDFG